MTRNLAVICPVIGVRSETFIQQHIQGLYPGRTVVVTNGYVAKPERAWDVTCPVLAERFLTRKFRHLGLKLGMDIFYRSSFQRMKSFLEGQRVDAVLAEYLPSAWSYMQPVQELGVRFYAYAHGFDLSAMYHDPLWHKRYADFAQADGVIVVNRVMMGRLSSLGVARHKIHCIPCGVEVPDTPLERETKSGPLRCLAVGRMVAKKGPLKLLESFKMAHGAMGEGHLDYIGTGPLFEQVRRYVENNKLAHCVTLHGGLDHTSVMELMMRAEVFMQHSIVDPSTGDEEGMPVAILEAMSMSLPVVSTRHAGIPDAVLDEETGFLVDEGDCRGMAGHLCTLAANPELRKTMGRAGWARASERFTWQRQRAELLAVMGLSNGRQ